MSFHRSSSKVHAQHLYKLKLILHITMMLHEKYKCISNTGSSEIYSKFQLQVRINFGAPGL
jgi:hypothetical protein